MADLSNNELRRIDLTLLLVFLGLLKHRKATAVAQELGLTQSAISQTLRRLREIFDDELFIRRPHGMEPTATALGLEAAIANVVETLRGALGTVHQFDPATAEGVVRIAALDAEQAVLIPPLVQRLEQAAPGLRLSVLPMGRDAAMAALHENRADLSLGFFWNTPEDIEGQILYEETYRVIGRPETLPNAPVIDLEAFCAANHILISPAGDLRGVVDDQLDRLGRARKVSLGLPAFLPAFTAVCSSDAIATLPRRMAESLAPKFGLVTAELPIEVRRFPISVYWHRRNKTSAQIKWLIAHFEQSVSENPQSD